MKIYFFGDIHGNGYALEACLEHAAQIKPDEIYCLGDIVGWLPFGERTLASMRSLGFPTVAGNHDMMVAGLFKDHPQQLDRMQATAYNAGLLSTIRGAVEYLRSLPLFLERENFLVTHNSPFLLPPQGEAPTIECFDYLSEAALGACLPEWSNFPKQVIFTGHDHVPAIYELPGGASSPPELGEVKVHRPPAGEGLTLRLRSQLPVLGEGREPRHESRFDSHGQFGPLRYGRGDTHFIPPAVSNRTPRPRTPTPLLRAHSSGHKKLYRPFGRLRRGRNGGVIPIKPSGENRQSGSCRKDMAKARRTC
ncbi:MAG: metallophosphoesterase family protein [Syntrophobacteraceae bacterium]